MNKDLQATPIATQPITQDFPALPQSFFARPAELVAPELIGCRLVKRQPDDSLLWGVIVETEAYSQDDPATRAYRRRTPSNDWWRLEVLIEARKSEYHQGSGDCFLHLIVASIKSMTSGIRWR